LNKLSLLKGQLFLFQTIALKSIFWKKLFSVNNSLSFCCLETTKWSGIILEHWVEIKSSLGLKKTAQEILGLG
jgi:hypothetical protein